VESLAERDEEERLPCAEAILAGTLALMTAHAQAACNVQRQRMAQKVELNLAGLAEYPALSLHFRLALSALTAHWQLLEHQDKSVREHKERSIPPAVSLLIH
jgi:hypothetical protein